MFIINLKWIPHVLNDEIKKKRVVIIYASTNMLNNICTEDETWIYFENLHKTMKFHQISEIQKHAYWI